MYYEIKRNLRTLAFGQQHLTFYQNWHKNQMIEQSVLILFSTSPPPTPSMVGQCDCQENIDILLILKGK